MSEPGASAGEKDKVSVPQGGPIYMSDMVGPLTKVADFEVAIFHELECLKAELLSDSLEMFNDEISVDDLKVISEEEFVGQAFHEAFKNDESPQAVLPEACTKNGSNKRKSNKKRGRNDRPKNPVNDEQLILKVEQLGKVREKQEEEKAEARLHSFNGSTSSSAIAVSSRMNGRMSSLKSISPGTKVKCVATCEDIAVHFPEVVLFIEVHHYKKTWVKTQEFLVLGRQFLTELKDKIYCISDEIMIRKGKDNHSGYFLVEDVFCNDLRYPDAIDYSKPILDWLQDSKSEALEKWEAIATGKMSQKNKARLGIKTVTPQLPNFKTVEMQKTRFCDLRFRLGAGYLYCHQGDCKHQVVIRDMRLIHPEDVQNRAAYPLITFEAKLRFLKCSVCKIYKAVKVTVDDKYAAENPCYFCDLCYYTLHYINGSETVNGSLLYDDFTVHDYLHE